MNNRHPRRLRRAAFSLLILALSADAVRLPAQGAYTGTTDQPGFGTGGRVFALGVHDNELIAGQYLGAWRDGSRLNRIGRFDGVRWQPLGNGLPSQVRTVMSFQGVLYAGGAFGVQRWNGTSWQIVGAGLAGEVWDFEIFGGLLHACGDFVVAGGPGGTRVDHIARFDGTAWQPLGTGLQSTIPSSVEAKDMVTDGQSLYVAGKFEIAGGTSAFGVARWNGTAWQGLGSGIPYSVYALALHGGRLYAGGNDIALAGGVPVQGLAAWNGQSWSSVGQGVQHPTRGAAIWSLATYHGELHVAGTFQFSGSTPLHHIARLRNNQLQPIGGIGMAEVNPEAIMTTVVWNERLYCGGEFRIVGDIADATRTKAAYHVASFDGVDWAAVGGGLGMDNQVRTFGRYQGQLVAGGGFSVAGGSQGSTLARFDGDDWRHFGTFDGYVTGMVESNGELWVVGQFQYVDGIPALGVARFDGTSWNAVGAGLGPTRGNCIALFQGAIHAGGTGSPLRWNGSSWQVFDPAIAGIITSMHVHQGRLHIGSVNAAGGIVHAWDGAARTVLGTTNGEIDAMHSWQGDLVVGGRFTSINGIPARCIARHDGFGWSAFGSGLDGTTVLALTTLGGELIAGGDFNRGIGGTADFVARWTGSQWAPLDVEQPNSSVWALLGDDARGEVHIGGTFFKVGARDAYDYAIYQRVPHWTVLPGALSAPRRTPHLRGEGSLSIGSTARWQVSSAVENTHGLFVVGFTRIDLPLLGGTLVPNPDLLVIFATDGIGTWTQTLSWPAIGAGISMWTQAALLDPSRPQGITATNAILMRAP